MDSAKAQDVKLLIETYRSKLSTKSPRVRTPSTPTSEASVGSEDEDRTDKKSPEPHNDVHPSTPGSKLAITVPRRTSESDQNDTRRECSILIPPTVDQDLSEWDFILPKISLPPPNSWPLSAEECEPFNLRNLVGIIQHGASLHVIENYLKRFDGIEINKHTNDEIDGFPAMFYIVETNREEILRLWVTYGGDATVYHKQSKIPLLAFAIIHSENIQTDTTHMTATLLSLGASSDVIPSTFYSPYLQDMPDGGPSDASLKDLGDPNKEWCKGLARLKLARTTNLSQRYYLDRASKTKNPSRRQIQVARKRNAELLLGIDNFLIGQNNAAKSLLDKILGHIVVPSKKPLVLVFAGPSGHGKTEMARCLGTLLSVDLEVVDCTVFNREMELFGPRQPYVGSENGSRLNNFLTSNSGKRCIVFLDEFEKTNRDIHKTLLLPFDNGEYQDRRNNGKINCSNTIWILATNAHDRVIQEFSATNHRVLFEDEDVSKKQGLLKKLSKEIKEDFIAHHGFPLAGRISAFVPFLPFSKGEQAVIVHKYLLELGRHVRKPINLTEDANEHLVGNIRMRIHRDASVCGILAESEYHIDLGARSLLGAVDEIKTAMVEEYLSVDDEITEATGMLDFIIDVNDREVVYNIVLPEDQ